MNKVLIFLCVSALTLSSVSLAMKNSEDQGKELCHAAKCGNHELVQKLFAQGAHVDARGENGATALMHAAYYGHIELCQMLINAKAQLNLKNKSGRTALMFAAENGQKNICLLLVDAMLDRSMLPGTMVAFLGIKKFHKSKFFKLIDPHIIKQIAHQACTNAPTMKDLFEQISEISDEAVKIDLCTHAQKRLKFRDQSRNDRLCIIA